MTAFTTRRKADRQKMAELVIQQARRIGCEADYHEHFGPDNAEIWVEILAPEGLRVTVSFEPKAFMADQFLLSWNMDYRSERRLAPGYWPSINPVHFRKATDFAKGFDKLTEVLEQRLTDAVAGVVYQPK